MHSVSRKGTKPLAQLKTIHNEHYSTLQNKHLAETELLNDLRLFCKQRAVIEREYGQALQKLATGFLSKRELGAYVPNDNGVSHGQSIWHVWRALLDESNNMALSRLRSSETQQRLCRELKPLKMQRITVNKRVFEQLRILQSDLAACVQEMSKSHKVYAEEEKQAQVTRLKTMAAEEKIHRRSTDIFHSMAQLHRNYEKLLSRHQACDARSATARNEYLFQLAAINAHLKHYFTKDVPNLVKVLDGDLYEKISDVLSSLCQTEVEVCTLTRDRFQRILRDATQITRTCAWEHFLKVCPLFDKTVQYQFEPIEGDETTLLRSPDAKDASLEQIARKLARRLVLRERRITSYENELKTLESGCLAPYRNAQTLPGSPDFENTDEVVSFNQEYVEHKAEEIRFAVRREEIELEKIEACLSLLGSSSVDVKRYITEARETAEVAAAAALAQRLREANSESVHDTQSVGRPKTSGEGSIDSMSITAGRFSDTQMDYCAPSQGVSNFQPGYSSQSRYYGASYSHRGTFSSHNFDNSLASRLSAIGFVVEPESKATDVRLNNQKGNTWNSRGAAGSISHDYQNVNLARRPKDDSAADHLHSRTEKSVSCNLSNAQSNDKNSGDVTDLELLWSENGSLRQASVLHEFRAKRPDELDLVVHETVVLLESEDKNGWIKVRSLIDGNEGLVPINFLRLHDLPSGPKSDAVNNREVTGVKIDLGPSGDDKAPNDSTKSHVESHQTCTKRSTLGISDQTSARRHHQSPVNSNVKSARKIRTSSLPPSSQAQTLSPSKRPIALDTTTSTTENDGTSRSPLCPGTFVRALVEFEGTNSDELHFCTDAIIRVLGKAPVPQDATNDGVASVNAHSSRLSNSFCSGVDDGWLEGELLIRSECPHSTFKYSRVRGVFPSMVVQPLSPKESEPWLAIWRTALDPSGTSQQPTAVEEHKANGAYSRVEESCAQQHVATNSASIGKSSVSPPLFGSPSQVDKGASNDDYIQWSTDKPHVMALQSLVDVMFDSSLRNPSDEELPIAEL
ncbi:unnamed protein product [Dicrocoelium dendriticum]|nr:unnamed protein product [Dicrocoelium dendriticum]